MREIWYQYLIDNKNHWCNGFTLKRLEKVKDFVLTDNDIMSDLLIRHGGNDICPEGMKIEDLVTFKHAIDNFSCSILYKMIEKGIYKIK